MRFLALAALVVVLVSPMAWAQQDGGVRNFGRVTCPQTIPCPGTASDAALSTSALMSMANTCITQYFGYANPKGFFDETAGLDTNNCFTAIPGILPKGAGTQLAPACCIINQPSGNMCNIRCELNTVN